MKQLFKSYTNLNTFIPLLVGVLLYIIPCSYAYSYAYGGEYYYLYDYNISTSYLFYLLSLLFIIIVMNWVHKILYIPTRVLYVINLVLYILLIIIFLVFFADHGFYFPMLVPILPIVYAIIQTKSRIDEVTRENPNEPNQEDK